MCITVCRGAVTCQDERGASALGAWEISQALFVTPSPHVAGAPPPAGTPESSTAAPGRPATAWPRSWLHLRGRRPPQLVIGIDAGIIVPGVGFPVKLPVTIPAHFVFGFWANPRRPVFFLAGATAVRAH